MFDLGSDLTNLAKETGALSAGSQAISGRRFLIWELRDDRGSALMEYAIVLPVILTFLFGIMDFSRFLYTYHFVSEVAREGTRYAMVRGSTFAGTSCASTATFSCDATSANVQSYVQALTPAGILSNSVSVTTTWPGTAPASAATACNSTSGNNSPGCLVQVVVSYPFKFILPFLPKAASTWTISSTSVVVISQ
jgi:Flp pilus assembly protein TadG